MKNKEPKKTYQVLLVCGHGATIVSVYRPRYGDKTRCSTCRRKQPVKYTTGA